MSTISIKDVSQQERDAFFMFMFNRSLPCKECATLGDKSDPACLDCCYRPDSPVVFFNGKNYKTENYIKEYIHIRDST